SVLDIGCGNGKQLAVFSDLVGDGGKVIGTDIFSQVPGLLENAREKLAGKKNVQLIDHNESLPFPQANQKFDIINSCYPFFYFIMLIMSSLRFKSVTGFSNMEDVVLLLVPLGITQRNFTISIVKSPIKVFPKTFQHDFGALIMK